MDIQDMLFKSPSKGFINIEEVKKTIIEYISVHPSDKYNITIGTDSQTDTETRMVLVICVCREGKGGIFFTHKEILKPISDLRSKIYNETSMSLSVADIIRQVVHNTGANYSFSVHADIGKNGPTKVLINEIVGWIEASGYNCKIKPDSYAASTVANKYSK